MSAQPQVSPSCVHAIFIWFLMSIANSLVSVVWGPCAGCGISCKLNDHCEQTGVKLKSVGNFLLWLQFGAGVKLPFITSSVYSCCALNSDRETGDHFEVTLDNSNLPVVMSISLSWCKLLLHLFDRPHLMQSFSGKKQLPVGGKICSFKS